MKDIADYSKQGFSEVQNVGRSLLLYTIARHKTININLDLKGPYIVVPELGSLQK